MAFFQNTFPFQCHSQVQSGLAANPGQNGIRTFLADDLGDIFQRQRLHIYLVGNRGVRHDGGRIAVAQDDFVAFFFQCQTGLCACIVKFRCLTDDNGAGANYHDAVDIHSLRHGV